MKLHFLFHDSLNASLGHKLYLFVLLHLNHNKDCLKIEMSLGEPYLV